MELLRWIQSFVAKNADKVITPSFYFKKVVSGWVGETRKVEAIYNGINLSFNPIASGMPHNSKMERENNFRRTPSAVGRVRNFDKNYEKFAGLAVDCCGRRSYGK